ncbi:MAG: hypothetical protein KGP14_14615 [Betaproteobacteria bacterium]|nr:hypothetical protein [Betaproteobacteria bacterium]
MFLSAHEIALGRERALNNLLEFSTAWIEAGHGLSAAVAAAGRSGIEQGSRRWSLFDAAQPAAILQMPASLWLGHLAGAARLLDEALFILGETQKAVIRSTEVQVRILDSMAIAAIDRASKTSPWEAEVALSAMRNSLQSAEQTLHDMSEVAIETIVRAENEGHQAAAALSATGPAASKAG